MSRVGKQPISIPSGTSVELMDGVLTITKGNSKETYTVPSCLKAKISETNIIFEALNSDKRTKSMWGTTQRNVANIVTGLNKDFSVTLKLSGVGYKASVNSKQLSLQLGFSHDLVYAIPDPVNIACPDVTTIVISGKSKKLVGDVASELKMYRKPEPYKGKGIIRQGELVYRKEGKKK